MVNPNLFFLAGVFAIVVQLSSGGAAAESRAAKSSTLMPPHQLDLYTKPYSEISEREQWRMRIHGLRHAILHPLIWGTRKAESTENRRIIPLKLFVLRSSEDPGYRLKSFTIVFTFKDIPPGAVEDRPRDFDPMLEIGLHGEYQRGAPTARPLLDRSYTVRMSGIPSIASGLYFRSLSTYLKLKDAGVTTLIPGKRYSLSVNVTPSGCELVLDGATILSYPGSHFDEGFVTLRSGWHPVTIEALEVRGERAGQTGREEVRESGLVPPLPESIQQVEPALKDLPVS